MTRIHLSLSSSDSLRHQERSVLSRALAEARTEVPSRADLAALVCAADASGLFTYGEIAELIGRSWLDVPMLVLEAPAPASSGLAAPRPGRRRPVASPRPVLAR